MNSRGQNISEYGVMLVVVIMALSAMFVYSKRGIQGVVKSSIDELGSQAEEEYFNLTGLKAGHQLIGSMETGLMNISASLPPSNSTEKITVADRDVNGVRTLDIGARTSAHSESQAVYATRDSFALFEKTRLPGDRSGGEVTISTKTPDKLATPTGVQK